MRFTQRQVEEVERRAFADGVVAGYRKGWRRSFAVFVGTCWLAGLMGAGIVYVAHHPDRVEQKARDGVAWFKSLA